MELDPLVVREIKRDLAKYSCNIYNHPRVNAIAAEGRAYIERVMKSSEVKYDLIMLEAVDTPRSFIQRSLTPISNYLFTRQAWETMLNILKPDGYIIADLTERNVDNLKPIIGAIPSNALVEIYKLGPTEESKTASMAIVVYKEKGFFPALISLGKPIEYPAFWRTSNEGYLTDDKPFWGRGS